MIRRPLPVARTRVVVPPPGAGLLERPRVQALLEPRGLSALAVVAGAGFGKTSALAAWAAARPEPTAWYSVAEGDDEEFQFLACLAAALEVAGVAVEEAGDLLDREGARGRAALDLLLSALVERPGLALVIDDAHRLRSEPVQEALGYLIRYLPAGVSLVLGARRPPELKDWRSLLLRGRAREVGAADLALDAGEVGALLGLRGSEADPGEVRERTGGWPLAVDVLARHGHAALPPGSADDLLAEEIWSDLGPEERDLLLRLSVLEVLTPAAAARVGGVADAPARLTALARQGLFLQALPEGAFRIHQLLRDFLRRRLDEQPAVRMEAFSAAADAALESGQPLEALEPLRESGRTAEAAALLAEAAPGLLAQARGPRLLDLGARLRASGWTPDARLLTLEADALRQGGEFEAALERYRSALEAAVSPEASSQALRGMARVYVDTVQPAPARDLLHRAFRVLPTSAGEERAAVLDLLAENAVNEGRAAGAMRFRRWARSLLAGRGPDRLDARILLRTGQLRAAREMLEARLAGRSEAAERPAEAHREEVLVLAYVAALQGEAEEAAARARQGIDAARAAGSRATEAVGWMRLAHALQLQESPEAAACYERAAELVETTGVARLQAEVLMGQALLHAHRGDVARSYACATEGLALTRHAGDAWLSAWLRLGAGISATLGGHPGAPDLLRGAEEELRRCRDSFGVAVTRVWLGQPGAAREAGYGFLLERPTLFGPRKLEGLAEAAPDPESAEPILRVQLLGPFRLWRRGVEVEPRAWKRLKARELFLILLTRRGSLQQKEHLMELLWPDASLQAANRDFRVALHALSEVLDPDRPRNEPARWLERRDAAYCFRTSAEVSLDLEDFERLARRAREEGPEESDRLMRRALALYRGDFLEDHPYADWAAAERERLRALYLEVAETVALRALEAGDEETAAETAHAMLARDRCWEEAWRILMRLHMRQGRAFMAVRAYEQCAQALEEELGVSPAEETEELYHQASQ